MEGFIVLFAQLKYKIQKREMQTDLPYVLTIITVKSLSTVNVFFLVLIALLFKSHCALSLILNHFC